MSNMIKKIKALPQGVKASVAFFLASVITSGISYIVTPIYTRLLTATEYGQTSVFMTWLHLFGIVAMFCLSAGVFNNGMIEYPDKRDEYSFSMLILSNIITLCVSGIFLCIYPLLRRQIGMDFPLVILMCVVCLVRPAYNFWVSRQRYELKYKTTVVWSIASAIASPLVAVICILQNDDNRLYARIFGAEIALIAIYLIFYIYLAIKSKCRVNTRYWKMAFLFNLPLIPHYLSTYLLSSSDKLMISYLINDTVTAYYSVAHSVASVLTIVWSAVNSSLVPYTYEKCKEKNYEAISNVTLPILGVFAVICIFVIMLAPEVVWVMATKEYMNAIYVIPPIIGGVFFQVQYFIYANVVYYYKKPKYVMFASITSTVLNIVLNYIFIKRYGYIAAGYTTIFCYLVQATIDYFAMRKVVGESVYNIKYIGCLSLAVVFIALFSNLIYDLAFIRYMIIVAVIIVVITFRKRIVAMFITLKKK